MPSPALLEDYGGCWCSACCSPGSCCHGCCVIMLTIAFIPLITINIQYTMSESLQWRHNGSDGVSNHRPRDCLLNRLGLKKQSLAFVRGIPRWPENFPHKWLVTQKSFPFDDVIMTRQGSGKKQLTVYPVLRLSPLPYPALLVSGPSVSLGLAVCFRLWSSPYIKVFKSSDPAQPQYTCIKSQKTPRQGRSRLKYDYHSVRR